jgi:hypothetical protein
MNARCFGASPLLWLLASLLSVSGCSCEDHKPAANSGSGDSGQETLLCAVDHVVCQGTVAKTCDGKGGFKQSTDCATHSQQCLGSKFSATGDLIALGCIACTPGEASCSDGAAKYCREDGSGFDAFDCDPMQGMVCEADGCKGACAPPEVTTSYIGCDYYPTVTLNPVWSGFDFAVAVSNASDTQAHVVVTRGDAMVSELTIDVNALEIIKLDWVSALKGGDQDACQIPPEPGDSRMVKQGAYRLRSDQPVTVYQFSPLEYQLGKDGSIPSGCPVGTMCPGGIVADCLSYSNDASLLLPATALTGDYTVLSWPSNGNTASFYAVTATADDTTVSLTGRASFRPGGGIDRTGTGQVMLNRGDVLEVVASHGTDTADASGSVVHADKPVQVIGGHSCANIPDPDTAACDHLEQALFPTQILGKDYVVTYPSAVASQSPHVVRIAAVQADTMVQFDPPLHAPVMLSPSDAPFELQIGSFTPGASSSDRGTEDPPVDVHISADKPIAIAQYMQGQASVPSHSGDPSMSLAVPTAQYRSDYIFTASTTYDSNFINVIAPIGTAITLDDKPLGGVATDVGSSNYQVIRLQLPAAGSGVYRLHAEAPVGLAVYGYGRYTSYMFPGGLDLKRLSEITPG